eukprot:1474776-Amphidinium_carterae.1
MSAHVKNLGRNCRQALCRYPTAFRVAVEHVSATVCCAGLVGHCQFELEACFWEHYTLLSSLLCAWFPFGRGLIDSAVAFAYLLVKLGVGHLSKDEIAVREFRPDELLTATAAMINHLCAMVE